VGQGAHLVHEVAHAFVESAGEERRVEGHEALTQVGRPGIGCGVSAQG
jgi:hypothetical protein